MGEPKTMTVEQGQCQIYPTAQTQLCMRVRVTVTPLSPGEADPTNWITDGEPLRHVELRCSQRGLERLLQKIDDGTKPPTPRQKREAKDDVTEALGVGD